jgi:hypothetical protein
MKKYILYGGAICAAPILLVIGGNYVATPIQIFFYPPLVILSLPFVFIPSVLPHFGMIGMGDVFGFIYLSDALTYVVYYFILGMFIGWILYRSKNGKLRKANGV